MKHFVIFSAFILSTAGMSHAEGRIATFCGSGHSNEVASATDVSANPDGYFIRSLGIQLSHGDPRIVQAVGKNYHLCTISAATPEMEVSRIQQLRNERAVRYLFVPTVCPDSTRSS